MSLNDFLFGSNDAQKNTEKAAKNAQWSPFLYAGPGGSLSGFGTIAPTPAGAAPAVGGTPSISNTGLPNGGVTSGLVDSGYKSDGHGLPIMVDPASGKTYVTWKGQLTPATGGVIGPDGKKTVLGAGGVIPGYTPPAPAGAAFAPTPGGGVQPQIPSPTQSTSMMQTQQAGPGSVDMSGGAGGGPAPPGTTIAPTNNPGQAAFGDLGNLNPIQAALVKAFPQLIQSGVQQSGGTNPNVAITPSPYNAFGDIYQHNLELLRQQAKPGEDQALTGLQNRLFAQGRLGSTGGSMNLEAFAKGLGEADVTRQLSAFQTAQGVAQQQEQSRLADMGITAQNIDRAIQQGNLTFQQAQQLFGNIASLNTIGSQNFTNALNASIARSNANAGAAGVLAQVPADNGAFASILNAGATAFAGK